MTNVLVITAYNKPELLYIGLMNILEDIKDYRILITTEEGYDPIQDEVLSRLLPDLNLARIVRKKKNDTFVGMRNILTSYLDARASADEYIILLEEDIIPTKDYIKFNELVYKDYLSKYDRIFCAAHKRRPETETNGDNGILIGDYQCTSPSVVSCKAIDSYLAPELLNEQVFTNTPAHYYFEFPNSRIPYNQHMHHDGFIERVMEKYKLFGLKPDQARSSHVGLHGIHGKSSFEIEGSLDERVKRYRELIKQPDKLRSLSNLPQEMVVAPINNPIAATLKLDLNRDLAKASSWWYDRSNEFKEYICMK